MIKMKGIKYLGISEMSSDINKIFSHIYVEKECRNESITKKILEINKHAEIIYINHYKDVFNRPNQDICIQKKSPALILAKKKKDYLYSLPDICHNYGYREAYYSSNILNCIFDCDYCYLQGVYKTSNILAFVNMDDFAENIKRNLAGRKAIVFLSYDSDLLALSKKLPFLKSWLKIIGDNPDIEFEIRTKSVNVEKLLETPPLKNLTLCWTLSPQLIIDKFEKLTPPLDERIDAIRKIQKAGYSISLAFDPVIKMKNVTGLYKELLNYVFNKIDKNSIKRVSIGMFRIPKDYLKQMKKSGKLSEVVYYPYDIIDGVATYEKEETEEIESALYNELLNYCNNVFTV
jgi:spore photoproduct lyase